MDDDDLPIQSTIFRGFPLPYNISIPAWWFGTFLYVAIQLGMSSSQLTNSYFSEV